MNYESITFIALLISLSVLQYLLLWIYLVIAEKTRAPTLVNRILITGSWILLVGLVAANGILGIELVRESNLNLNVALGVLPLVAGFGLSFLTKRSQWKTFFKRYPQKID